jgi:hypothetical protein
MKINFITTDNFSNSYKRLKKKYPSLKDDLLLFQEELRKNPQTGTDLGGGIYKIRIAIKSKNKGKSGGARVITFQIVVSVTERNVLLVAIYDKSTSESISDGEIKKILKISGFLK